MSLSSGDEQHRDLHGRKDAPYVRLLPDAGELPCDIRRCGMAAENAGSPTILLVFVVARMYEAVDHPTDIVAGLVLGVGIPVVGFRMFTPNEMYPVTYRRGRTAHLDVGGRRGKAIKTAVRDQLGLEVLEVKPVGLEGSGGSTPLRLRVSEGAGGAERYLFSTPTGSARMPSTSR